MTPRSSEVGRKLLDAILAAPDDDTPRLIYADWLLEDGDPRGEFIQVQCLLGRAISGSAGVPAIQLAAERHPDHAALAAREEALHREHGSTWLSSIRPFIQRWTWRRGFVERLTAGPNFFDGAEGVLASHPIVDLGLIGLNGAGLDRLAALDLRTVRRVGVPGESLGRIADVFLGPNFANLETLVLRDNPIRDAGVIELATRSHLTKLRALSLVRCRIGDSGVRAIAESPLLGNLERLALDGNSVSSAGIVALARSTHLPRLFHVELRNASSKARAALDALAERRPASISHATWDY